MRSRWPKSKRALADAFEHDRIELSFGDQIQRWIETIGGEPGPGAEAELIASAHFASLAFAPSGSQSGLTPPEPAIDRSRTWASSRWFTVARRETRPGSLPDNGLVEIFGDPGLALRQTRPAGLMTRFERDQTATGVGPWRG
jgi:hypothetical protein